jgi:hypothetical protein
MGAALTYALFALVGIAGKDGLDAPDVGSPPAEPRAGNASKSTPDKRGLQRPPTLSPEQSAQLREQMSGEIGSLTAENDLLAWAQTGKGAVAGWL